MSNPVSQPVAPPQPDQEVYGIQELGLFSTYTRDSYRVSFGIEAPPWDPSRVTKTWFDSTVDTSNPANIATYQTIALNQTDQWAMGPLVLPAPEAATVNLPGIVVYPPYVVVPTDATRGGSVINPIYLSMELDARAMMALFGATDLSDEGATAEFPVLYPPDEPRRMWDIVFKGGAVNVGALQVALNANGVGAPGQWDTSGSEPVWVPAPAAPSGLDDTRPPRPMPVRNLLANEIIQPGLMGVSIVRTDLAQQANAAAGQFTPDDRATLQQIFNLVSKLGF